MARANVLSALSIVAAASPRPCCASTLNAHSSPTEVPNTTLIDSSSPIRIDRAPRPADTVRTKTQPLQLVRVPSGTQRTVEPIRTARPIRAGGRAGHCHPFLIDLVRLRGVDDDVAVLVVGAGFRQRDPLVPAVHAADRIRLHRARQVLVPAHRAPPGPLRARTA